MLPTNVEAWERNFYKEKALSLNHSSKVASKSTLRFYPSTSQNIEKNEKRYSWNLRWWERRTKKVRIVHREILLPDKGFFFTTIYSSTQPCRRWKQGRRLQITFLVLSSDYRKTEKVFRTCWKMSFAWLSGFDFLNNEDIKKNLSWSSHISTFSMKTTFSSYFFIQFVLQSIARSKVGSQKFWHDAHFNIWRG